MKHNSAVNDFKEMIMVKTRFVVLATGLLLVCYSLGFVNTAFADQWSEKYSYQITYFIEENRKIHPQYGDYVRRFHFDESVPSLTTEMYLSLDYGATTYTVFYTIYTCGPNGWKNYGGAGYTIALPEGFPPGEEVTGRYYINPYPPTSECVPPDLPRNLGPPCLDGQCCEL